MINIFSLPKENDAISAFFYSPPCLYQDTCHDENDIVSCLSKYEWGRATLRKKCLQRSTQVFSSSPKRSTKSMPVLTLQFWTKYILTQKETKANVELCNFMFIYGRFSVSGEQPTLTALACCNLARKLNWGSIPLGPKMDLGCIAILKVFSNGYRIWLVYKFQAF